MSRPSSDPFKGTEEIGLTCEFAGHEWQDAGGGLEICAVCETEQWADSERSVAETCAPEVDQYG